MANKPHKNRKRLSDRWLDYCDRVAFNALDEQQIPPGSRGISLLALVAAKRIGSFFYPQWLADARKRRASEKNVDVDARGFGKFTEFLESIATGIAYQVQAVGSWCYRLIVPEKLIKSTERAVVEKSVDAFWDIRNLTERLAKRFVPTWLRTRLGKSSWFSSVYSFCMAWGKSRTWKKLLLSLPAVLLALPLVGAVTASLVYSPTQKLMHYRRALAVAVENRDEQAEEVYLQKLSQLGFGQMDRAEFFAALTLAGEDGKWDEAVDRMQKLAPLNDPGYAEAHIWIADKLMRKQIDVPNSWERIEKHAQHALALSAGRNRNTRNSAKLLLARAKGRRGQVTEAIDEMDALADAMPTLHFELMQQKVAGGDVQGAKRHARKVVAYCEDWEAREKERQLLPYHFHAWALASQLTDGQKGSETVLRRAFELFPDDKLIRTQLLAIISPPLVGARLEDTATLELLKEVFAIDEANVNATLLLARAVEAETSSTRTVIEQLIEDKALPATACLKLGDTRWAKKDANGAVWYYERAAEITPDLGAAWNNVAWLRGCVDDTRDLDLAIVAANRAIELNPDPRCFETRGQIYAQLKKWPDAIKDLERAVNGSLPDSRPAHATLAEALSAIGDKEAAAAHLRKSKR